MKRYFLQGLVIAGALVAQPALAQKTSADKSKKGKDIQTIVITREGNITDKTVIEIKGDKVTVNGKDADKSPDVNVNVNTIKSDGHISINGIGGRNTWTFSGDDDDSPTFFNADENRAMLGVITELDSKGARVTSVTEGSAADKAGLKKGDIITRIDKEEVKQDGDVAKAIRAHKPGDKVNITVERAGKEQTLSADLTKWKGLSNFWSGNMDHMTFNMDHPDIEFQTPTPPNPPGAYMFRYNNEHPRLGISIQDTEDGKGVKITDVDDETPAAKSGLKENDIILQVDETKIESTDALKRITTRAKQGSSYQFKIVRAGKEQTVEVKFPRKIKTADL